MIRAIRDSISPNCIFVLSLGPLPILAFSLAMNAPQFGHSADPFLSYFLINSLCFPFICTGFVASLFIRAHWRIKWIQEYNGDLAVCFIALLEKRIIGMIDASIPKCPEKRHTCEFGMSVLKEFRNQGLGSILIDRVTDWALSKSVERLELCLFSHNAPAIALYRKKGFVEEGRRIAQIQLTNGKRVDMILMAKQISSFKS
jgi:RimJ/RimL family protein N-acetyltransferase